MREGRQTVVHPLSTTDDDENTVAGNRDMLDAIFQHHLALSKDEIARHIYLVGGDLATIERLRNVSRRSAEGPSELQQE